MNNTSFTYHTETDEIVIRGFIASLLHQQERWDWRCTQKDAHDYHELHYARMDSTEALKQELAWWMDCYVDERLFAMPHYELLIRCGVSYLLWRVNETIEPLSEEEKLNTNMAIFIDGHSFLYKQHDAMMLSTETDQNAQSLIHGFPAQLLSYAACSAANAILSQKQIQDLDEWLDVLWGWLQPTPSIRLQYLSFDIPNVYDLYTAFVDTNKQAWDALNQKLYTAQQPQTRGFMQQLLKATKLEAAQAAKLLLPLLSEKQYAAFMHYMEECQVYIADHTKTRKKGRIQSMEQYWCPGITDYRKNAAVRKIKKAVADPHPAAALAEVVHLLQKQGILGNIRPHTQFIAVINKLCGSNINHDSFSKYFKGERR